MCGRFVHAVAFQVLADWFDGKFAGETEELYEPRWNISPTSSILGVRLEDGERVISPYRWGLASAWMKELPRFATHNARVETIATKPAYRSAYRAGRRVLISADGYYEWQLLGDGPKPEKQPWYMAPRADEPLMAFAGLYEWWRPDPHEPWIATCTVITTGPGADVADIHDRQPVVVARDQWDVWLDPETSVHEARSLLVPAPGGTFARRRVGRSVGNSRSEGSSLIAPID